MINNRTNRLLSAIKLPAKGKKMIQKDRDMFSAANESANDELAPFDVRDSSGKAGMIKLALGFGFLLILALVILKIYQPGVRDRADPPKITAENTPFKIKPEDEGGVQTPNQDKTVYEVMDGKTPTETVNPSPVPEVPIELPKAANIKVDPAPVTIPKTTQPKTTTAPVLSAPAAQQVAVGSSEWVVQVASVRTQQDAQAIWNKVSTKFDNVLSPGHYADIKYADLAEKGVYYRLRVAGLPDKSAASSLCSAFEAQGQACFVTRK